MSDPSVVKSGDPERSLVVVAPTRRDGGVISVIEYEFIFISVFLLGVVSFLYVLLCAKLCANLLLYLGCELFK